MKKIKILINPINHITYDHESLTFLNHTFVRVVGYWYKLSMTSNYGDSIAHIRKELLDSETNWRMWERRITMFVIYIYFSIRENSILKSVFCGSRWTSKTLVVSGSYKRCTPWLELKICCADVKSFTIMLCPLRTMSRYWELV